MPTRVLVVEDEPILVSLYTLVLAKAGYDVSTALDAESGEEQVVKLRPHVILLDLLIPDQPSGDVAAQNIHEPLGFRVLRFVKSTPSLADMRVIVLSNLDSDEHIQRATDLGADDYVVKSDMDPHQLHDRVEAVLHSAHPKTAK